MRWPRSVRHWLVAIAGALLFVLAFIYFSQTPDDEAMGRLRVGANTLELDAGTYGVWWQAPVHAEGRTEFSDFEFELRGPDDTVVLVQEPRFFTGVEGERSDLTLWSIGAFALEEPGTVELQIRVVGEVEPGRPVLLPNR